MKHALPPLDSLKVFEAAARHLSFSMAADELCITKGAVSYQIRKLEEHLQCSLFKRAVRQVYLTDAGQTLHQTTQRLFRELGETLSQLSGDQQQAGVSVAASTYVAARWLSSRISQFNDRYPNIPIFLQHSVNSADFKLSEVDIAIRWGLCKERPERHRLGEIPMPLFPVASPSLLRRHGLTVTKPYKANALLTDPFKNITLLCEDRVHGGWQEWLEVNTGHQSKLENPRRIISDANVRVQAAVDGQGMIMADDLMRTELDNGLLLRPFQEELSGYGYGLLSAPARISGEGARLLKDWLSRHLNESA